jgi:predicted  nucleic acid-binding Zn-ribbon protein
MHQCDQCGGEVTDQYWRVFSVEGVLHGCLNCEKKTGNHVPSDARSRSRSAEA